MERPVTPTASPEVIKPRRRRAERPTRFPKAGMVPRPHLLPDTLPTERLNERAKPTRELRDELRRINNAANAFTLLGALVQTFGVVALAGWLNTWWAYLGAFVLMIRGHALLNILAHEAAHRLLFSNQRINDGAGRWLLGYPSLQAMLAYRRAHFAHHRDEMGPNEPDFSLYDGYPITRASLRRKLVRDAVGISAWKNLKVLIHAIRRRKPEALQILAVQLVMVGVSIAVTRPLMYVVWFLAWSTGWKVSNRLRALAEHGGLTRSKDRRETTHVIRQSWLPRFWIAPYNTGWHLAHHVDMGVPWRNLPRLHNELVASRWLVPDIEYPNYRALWRELSSRAEGEDRRSSDHDPARGDQTSFLSFDS